MLSFPFTIHFLLLLSYLTFICTFTPIPTTSASSSTSEETSIYDVLSEHGLPQGLFPKGVKEFEIDEDGRFWVHLDQACNAKFENELHYDQNVSGSLSYEKIDALTGVEAQDLFLWFPVMSIRVDEPNSGLICFDMGAANKKFSLSLFETPPDCVAVESEEDDGFRSDDVSKSQFGRLGYGPDQGTSGRDGRDVL